MHSFLKSCARSKKREKYLGILVEIHDLGNKKYGIDIFFVTVENEQGGLNTFI